MEPWNLDVYEINVHVKQISKKKYTLAVLITMKIEEIAPPQIWYKKSLYQPKEFLNDSEQQT